MFHDRGALARQIVRNRLAKILIHDVMRRPGWLWKIAAQKLVAALCACFDALETARNGKIDGLVIAGLEMQERNVGQGAPVAAVQSRAVEEIQRPGNRLTFEPGDDQKNLLAHAGADAAEKLTRQIRRIPLRVSRLGIG